MMRKYGSDIVKKQNFISLSCFVQVSSEPLFKGSERTLGSLCTLPYRPPSGHIALNSPSCEPMGKSEVSANNVDDAQAKSISAQEP